MDELERSIEQVKLQKRGLDDLIEEFNIRLYGPSTDENLDRVEELRIAIESKRKSDLQGRVAQLERRLQEHQSYLIIIGIIAVVQAFVSTYGRDAVKAWTPLVAGVIFVWFVIVQARAYFRRRALKRSLFGS